MNKMNKNKKIYRILAMAFVIVLTLGVTMIAMAQAAPGGAEKAAVQVELADKVLRPALPSTMLFDGLDPVTDGCMGETSGFGSSLNCTAEDVTIANVTNLTILDDGC